MSHRLKTGRQEKTKMSKLRCRKVRGRGRIKEEVTEKRFLIVRSVVLDTTFDSGSVRNGT